jgi:hypothetical protein
MRPFIEAFPGRLLHTVERAPNQKCHYQKRGSRTAGQLHRLTSITQARYGGGKSTLVQSLRAL